MAFLRPPNKKNNLGGTRAHEYQQYVPEKAPIQLGKFHPKFHPKYPILRISPTSLSSKKALNMPMALEPPPTHATTRSSAERFGHVF